MVDSTYAEKTRHALDVTVRFFLSCLERKIMDPTLTGGPPHGKAGFNMNNVQLMSRDVAQRVYKLMTGYVRGNRKQFGSNVGRAPVFGSIKLHLDPLVVVRLKTQSSVSASFKKTTFPERFPWIYKNIQKRNWGNFLFYLKIFILILNLEIFFWTFLIFFFFASCQTFWQFH